MSEQNKHEDFSLYEKDDIWATEITISDLRIEQDNWYNFPHTTYQINTTTSFPRFGGTTFSVR